MTNQIYINRKSLDQAIREAFKYCNKSSHQVSHLRVVFDVNQASTLLQADMKDNRVQSEAKDDLPYTTAFSLMQIIEGSIKSYVGTPLTKVTIDCDLDLSGILYDSVQVKYRFKMNQPNQEVTTLLGQIFDATEKGECTQYLAAPVDTMLIHIMRHKLRNMDLISHFKVQNPAGVEFSDEYRQLLGNFIHDYLTYPGNRQPGAKLEFDVCDRELPRFKTGQIYPDVTLSSNDGKFQYHQVRYVIRQLNEVLWLIPRARIIGMEIKQNWQKDNPRVPYYMTMFTIGNQEQTDSQQIPDNIAAAKGMTMMLTQVIQNYTLPIKMPHNGRNQVSVGLEAVNGQWNVEFQNYQIINQLPHLQSTSASQIVSGLQSVLTGQAKIRSFDLTMEGMQVTRLVSHIDPLEAPEEVSTDTIMDPIRGLTVRTKGQLTRRFTVHENGKYYQTNLTYQTFKA